MAVLAAWTEWFFRLGGSGYGLPNVLLEWLLIGAVVYLCMRFLRDTRGSRVFMGVAFVLVAATLLVK